MSKRNQKNTTNRTLFYLSIAFLFAIAICAFFAYQSIVNGWYLSLPLQ